MVFRFLAWLSPVAAITIQDLHGRAASNVSLADGAMACERPAGWCAKKSIRYSLEDCNLDGIKDQVCDNSLASATDKRKSIRLSGECNTYDIGKAEVPDCGAIREKRRMADHFIYITKSDHKVYKQELSKMSLNSPWIEAGQGPLLALVVYKDGFFGIGTDHKIYRQSFAMLSTSSKWKPVGKGPLVAGDAVDDTFYGVGTDGLIYSQQISSMSPETDWTKVVGKAHEHHIVSIAIHKASDTMYAVTGDDGKLWKMTLSDLGSDWANVPQKGACFYISIRGDYIYCRGTHKQIWRQKLTSLTATSSWSRISSAGAESVLVPKMKKCRGTLLEKKGDDIACDSIKDGTCGNFYEKAGHTDVYFQCQRSRASPASELEQCLAQEHCLLDP